MRTYMLGGALCVGASSVVLAQDCIDYSQYSHWVTSVDYRLHDMEIVEDRLYATSRDAELIILDVSDPLTPMVLGEFGMYIRPAILAVNPPHVYIAQDNVRVVDASDPSGPTAVGEVEIPGDASAIVVHGSHSAFGDGSMTPTPPWTMS